MRRVLHRLVMLFRGDRAEAEAAREIAAHRALLEDDYQRRGMNADAARRALAFDRLFSDPATRLASGIHMIDLDALLLIVLSITVVAVIACLVPIRRAARVDPLVALRTG